MNVSKINKEDRIDKIQTTIEKNARKKLDARQAKKIDKKINIMLEKENVDPKEYKYDFYKFVDNFNILAVTMGTIIAFSANTVIQEITRDIIVPIFMNLIKIDKFYLFGIPLSAEKTVGNFFYLFLVVLIVTFIFRLLFKDITGRIIRDKELTKLIDKEVRYKEISLLEQIKDEIGKLNKQFN